MDGRIAGAATSLQPVLHHIRSVVHQAAPAVVETIKWGMVFFELDGKILARLGIFKQHCSFGFWSGSMPAYLAQQGFTARGDAEPLSRLTSLDGLPSPERLHALVRHAAAEIETGTWQSPIAARPKVAPANREALPVPNDFAEALRQNSAAHKQFQAFSRSCQREYLDWVESAKRAETRTRRIAEAVATIAEGKARNWQYMKSGTAARAAATLSGLLLAGLLCGARLSAQSAPAAADPAPVQVTSFRQSTVHGDTVQIDRGMVITEVTNASALDLIEAAYGVREESVTGLPAWASRQRYDLTFTGGALSEAGTSTALQGILAARFHLQVERQSKATAVYTLTVAPTGAKLQAAPAEAEPATAAADDTAAAAPNRTAVPAKKTTARLRSAKASDSAQGEIALTGGTADLAEALRAELDRPVLDRTGLTGTYAIALHWPLSSASATAVAAALQQQLGLALQPGDASLPSCAVQRIEQPGMSQGS